MLNSGRQWNDLDRAKEICQIIDEQVQEPSFFLIRIVGGGVQTGSTRHVGHWMAYCTLPGRLGWWRIWWNEDWQGKPKYSEKTCSSATLSATNPTWPDPGSNPGRRGGKPATNRLSYGAATETKLLQVASHWICLGHTWVRSLVLPLDITPGSQTNNAPRPDQLWGPLNLLSYGYRRLKWSEREA
jgi:hypothetical protein